MNKRSLDLLYRSFDAQLSEDEKAELASALASSESLRREEEAALAMRDAVRTSAVRSFKPFFSSRVLNRMKALEKPNDPMEELWKALVTMFRPVAVAGALTLVAILAFNLASAERWTLDTMLGVSEPGIEEVWTLTVLEESNQ